MSQENFLKYNLKNGIKLLCRSNSINPTVSIHFCISTGSVLDPEKKAGLSNFAGGLITKGTSKKNSMEIAEEIDCLGMELGFSTGGHTSTMSARVLSENLVPALKLISEILSDPKPSSDEMEKMRERIMTGIMMAMDDPASRATEKMSEMIYGSTHPYGQTSEILVKSLPEISHLNC